MKKIRLREDSRYSKRNTAYGLVTHEWTLVPDNAYVYNDMEVFGEQKPIVAKFEVGHLDVIDDKGIETEIVAKTEPFVDKIEPILPKSVQKKAKKVKQKRY